MFELSRIMCDGGKTPSCDGGTTPVVECACYRIVQNLVESDWEQLETCRHAHWLSMGLSCYAWRLELTVQNSLGEAAWGMALPVGGAQFTAPIDPASAAFRVQMLRSNFEIVMVLRQWVEEAADERNCYMMERLPMWDAALDACRSFLCRARERDLESQDAWRIRGILNSMGLPGTPGTVRYIIKLLAPDLLLSLQPGPEPLPTRGVKVTSYLVLPKRTAEARVGQVLYDTAGDSSWLTKDLHERARQVIASHAAWMSKISPAPITKIDKRSTNGRQRGAPGSRKKLCGLI